MKLSRILGNDRNILYIVFGRTGPLHIRNNEDNLTIGIYERSSGALLTMLLKCP